MHLPTHALLTWILVESGQLPHRRDRLLVLAAGVAPDLDALSILAGHDCYFAWHRTLLHHGLAAAGFALLASACARQRLRTGLLALAATHLHFLCDLVGSAGPDGFRWPVPYLVPFVSRSEHPGFVVAWQWGLSSWQNLLVTIAALAACIGFAVARGRTLFEFWPRLDATLVTVARRRFGKAPTGAGRPQTPSTR